jgi:hypothetical protein
LQGALDGYISRATARKLVQDITGTKKSRNERNEGQELQTNNETACTFQEFAVMLRDHDAYQSGTNGGNTGQNHDHHEVILYSTIDAAVQDVASLGDEGHSSVHHNEVDLVVESFDTEVHVDNAVEHAHPEHFAVRA